VNVSALEKEPCRGRTKSRMMMDEKSLRFTSVYRGAE
jgi:hypothetical protein